MFGNCRLLNRYSILQALDVCVFAHLVRVHLFATIRQVIFHHQGHTKNIIPKCWKFIKVLLYGFIIGPLFSCFFWSGAEVSWYLKNPFISQGAIWLIGFDHLILRSTRMSQEFRING